MSRYWYLLRNITGIDIGIRGFIRLLILSLITATLAACVKGFSSASFDWRTFRNVLCVALFLILLQNLLNTSVTFKDLLSPKSGRQYLTERKMALGGIIQRINLNISKETQPAVEEVKIILRELLDVIVLHVRDYRGNHNDAKRVVFASILLESDDNLIVVARDSMSHHPQYERPIPKIYTKTSLLCGHAMESKKALSVGKLSSQYPHGPQNKPYDSILAIPLIGSASDEAYGCLSVDCSRPYFFESLRPDYIESQMENSLQPYIHLITMVLECLVSRSPEVVVGLLIDQPVAKAPARRRRR